LYCFKNSHKTRREFTFFFKVTGRLAAPLAAALFIVLSFIPALPSESYYTINGRRVPKNAYDAALLVQQAGTFASAGNFERASGKLRMALACDPDCYSAHANLGILLARKGKNKEALIHLQKAIDSKDFSPPAYLNLASFYQGTGNLDSAIDTFKLLLERSSERPDISEYAGNILKMLEKERDRRSKYKGSAAKESGESEDYFVNLSGSPPTRWTDFRMPLKVYIDPSPEAEGFDPHYSQLLRQSFVDWEKACKGKFSFLFVADKETADIDCYWTDDVEKLGNGTENGNATTLSRAGVLNHARIVLRSKEPEGGFPFNDNVIISTCRHEVAHALGLAWHSPCPDDLMFFSIPLADKEQTISARDRNTVLKLYATSVPWNAAVLDFMVNPGNWKVLVPVITVGLMFVWLIVFVLRNSSKKKRKKH
jgi:predicted Zn-dependent protease